MGNEICGAVISVRGNEDIISLWNRTATDSTITGGIRWVCLCVSMVMMQLSNRDTMTRVMEFTKEYCHRIQGS